MFSQTHDFKRLDWVRCIFPRHFDWDLVKSFKIDSRGDSKIKQTIFCCLGWWNVNFPLNSFAIFTNNFPSLSFETSLAIVWLVAFFSTFATFVRLLTVYFKYKIILIEKLKITLIGIISIYLWPCGLLLHICDICQVAHSLFQI